MSGISIKDTEDCPAGCTVRMYVCLLGMPMLIWVIFPPYTVTKFADMPSTGAVNPSVTLKGDVASL